MRGIDEDVARDRFAEFVGACKAGDLLRVIALHNTSRGADDNAHADLPFRAACGSGHAHVARWLLALGDVDIHASDDDAFWQACENGHLDIAKWLYDLGDVNVPVQLNSAFNIVCLNGQLHVAKWLLSLGVAVAQPDAAFYLACQYGRLDVAKWLHGTCGVDVRAHGGREFRVACSYGHLHVASWLHGLGGVDVHADDDHAIRSACRWQHPQVAVWLDSDEIWGSSTARDKPAACVQYCQSIRWSLLRSAWIEGIMYRYPFSAS